MMGRGRAGIHADPSAGANIVFAPSVTGSVYKKNCNPPENYAGRLRCLTGACLKQVVGRDVAGVILCAKLHFALGFGGCSAL